MERAITPRNVRIFINVTAELKERLQILADKRGWSLSKAGYLALVQGVEILEEENDD